MEDRTNFLLKDGVISGGGGELREGCGGCGERSEPQHCPERSEGIAEAKAEPVAARPEHTTAN